MPAAANVQAESAPSWARTPILFVGARVRVSSGAMTAEFGISDASFASRLPLPAESMERGEPRDEAGRALLLDEVRSAAGAAVDAMILAGGRPAAKFWGGPGEFAKSLALSKTGGRWVVHGEVEPAHASGQDARDGGGSLLAALPASMGVQFVRMSDFAADIPGEVARCEAKLPIPEGSPQDKFDRLGDEACAGLLHFLEALDLGRSVPLAASSGHPPRV